MSSDVEAPSGVALGGMEPGEGRPVPDQSKEVARIAAFSDGVFAIAITLLALEIGIPQGTRVDVWAAIWTQHSVLSAFLISFFVIGVYWAAHHRLFSVIERYDERLVWLNLFMLLFIVLMPFTTSLIGEHGGAMAAVILYTLAIASVGCIMSAMAAYALHGNRLGGRYMSERMKRHYIWRGLKIAAVFLVPLVLLPLGASVIELTWLVLIMFEQIVAYRVVASDVG